MKRVLITGVNSYVGNNLADWLAQYPEDYEVHKISVRGNQWKEKDFSRYDSIVHVAGLVHQKETQKNIADYYKVNRDLTIAIAKKAKKEQVSQFIFLSTMSVYGLDTGVITKDTPLKPKSHYGKSKLEAEQFIETLNSEAFKVAIVRPPMIYGKNCPGNYQRLRWLALKTPIFPDVDNKRSMIYIDNLSVFLKIIINKNIMGVFCPQNNEYVNTSKLVKEIADNNNKKIYLTKTFNLFIKQFKLNILKRVFGTLIYKNEKNVDLPTSFIESIKKTEGSMK